MFRKSLFLLGLALLLLVPLPILADEDDCNLVYLFDAWARATPEGAPNGAVFGLLVNLSNEEDSLISARTEVAEVVELHETIMADGDVMQMRPVEGGFTVAPNNYLELRPAASHIMLINLNQSLEAGNSFELTLVFEKAGEVTLNIPIREMTEMEGEMMGEMPAEMNAEMTPEATAEAMLQWDESCVGIHVLGAWARPAAAGMPNSAAYALLLNLSPNDDILLSANTSIANVVELHEMTMGANDVMQMRPVEGGILVPAGGTAFLRPGGLHIMLIELTDELAVETSINLVLEFEQNGIIELTVPVQEPLEN